MRILYITPSLQHPKMRGPTRHYHFLRYLSQRHAITLLAPTRSAVCPEAMNEISSYTERLIVLPADDAADGSNGQAKRRLPVARGWIGASLEHRRMVRQMRRTVNRLLREEKFDVLLFHGKFLLGAIRDCRDLPVAADFCDATSLRVRAKMRHVGIAELPLQAARYLQVRLLEQRLVRRTLHLAFISCRDREAVLGPASRAEVIPNGIDLDYWRRSPRAPEPNCLVFTGVMSYAPNQDAALYLIQRIVPRVLRSVPDLKVLIVGRDPSPALQEQARRHPAVTVTGFVDDMRPYLERASVFAAPLRYGAGMQNKIQEALAMEVPVVTTSLAAAGLRAQNAEPPVCVADGDSDLARSVIDLLRDAPRRAAMAAQGRRFAEEQFVWPRSAARLEELCVAAAGRERNRSQTERETNS